MSIAECILPEQGYGCAIFSHHSFVRVLPVLVNIRDVERQMREVIENSEDVSTRNALISTEET